MPGSDRKRLTPALWVGLECTVNRVEENYVDQCRKNGHREREADLARFAELGAERIRYPFLWEWADDGVTEAAPYDWSWADDRTKALKRHGLEPIVGFVHHGSGPRHTSLVDPMFPEKLAHYAGEFAARYPWLTDYTPVNEPLTTARFSGLYGFWYPHGRDDRTFVRCLYQEIKGTVLTMEAVRRVNPKARLIQTDDMGRASGTPGLQYQVDHENERRWLAFDLLCGRVDEGHRLYRYLRNNGLSRDELKWLRDNPCPPDVIGINHYLLSNRFLDHRREFYPAHLQGGNGQDSYADVGAVDTGRAELPTPFSVLEETWKRYGLPIAVTEVHVNGPRETQMRWLKEVWSDACRLKEQGADLQAVTVWALLGSFDWNSCCTRDDGFYESGVFDVRAEEPRPTALAKMAKALGQHGNYEHPLLLQPGWWKLPTRAMFARRTDIAGPDVNVGPPILITGATGTLGRAFARICQNRSIPHRLVSRQEMDICDPDSVRATLDRHQPWAVINCAGYVRVDEAEQDQDRCFRENVAGPELLALLTAQKGIPLLSFSSDMVFDGGREEPYLESHATAPLNVYGRSKAEKEARVLQRHPGALIVRTSSFFGPWDEHNFITTLLRRLGEGENVGVASDLIVSPTYVPDLVNACLDLLVDGEKGVVHLTNRGALSWADFAKMAVDIAGRHAPFEGSLGRAAVDPRLAKDLGWAAARPRFSALSSEKANILPSLEDALNRYFNELEVAMPKRNAASVTGGAA
jgi:dTDP-4-dehydrorhamnose reductase